MRRSMERSLQLEQRNKRWSRGYPAGAGKNFLTLAIILAKTGQQLANKRQQDVKHLPYPLISHLLNLLQEDVCVCH